MDSLEIKKTITQWKNDANKDKKGKLALAFWHHFNNMIDKIEKLLNKGGNRELSMEEQVEIIDYLQEYLHKTSRQKESDRCVHVRTLIEKIEKSIAAIDSEEDDDNPRAVRVSDANISYGIFNRKTKIKSTLFPGGRPIPEDVKQGLTDLDCYLLSPLISIAQSNPQAIQKCFIDYPNGCASEEEKEKFEKAKTIRIRLYKAKYDDRINTSANGKVIIVVDKSAMRGGGTPWVRLLEKAFSVYRSKGLDPSFTNEKVQDTKVKSRAIDGINGSDSCVIITAITGEKSKGKPRYTGEKLKKFPSRTPIYTKQAEDIYTDIKNLLTQKKAISAVAEKGRSLHKKGLFLRHVYAVVGVEEDTEEPHYKYIKVQNPYRGEIRKYKKSKDGSIHSKTGFASSSSEKGFSKIELNDFINYFSYDYSK